jgi:cob(I)alamin adenosyltransferase
MKIYTRTGDAGTTGLLGGTRLPKNHIRIEAYGTVDELNAHIGLLRDHDALVDYRSALIAIQEDLFVIGSHLASDPEKNKMTLPELNPNRVGELEAAMDAMDAELEPMRNFVLPGGHPAVSHCHITRCVCRRAERTTIALAQSALVNELLIRYLNRLSDYFFVLSRKIAHDLQIVETPWVSR